MLITFADVTCIHVLSNKNCFCVSSVWDSMRNPVLYGIGAALVVGLLSIVLGLITSRCCFSRNPMHTPRSKLMELEMDWATWPKPVLFLLQMWPLFTLTHFKIAWLLMSLRNCIEPQVFRYVRVHCCKGEKENLDYLCVLRRMWSLQWNTLAISQD